jgi:outer membrane protein TolC
LCRDGSDGSGPDHIRRSARIYRHDVGSITDVTSAERQLLAAKDAATDAYSTALSSAATLALAGGALGAAPAH